MSILPAAGYISDGARTEGENKQAFEDLRGVVSELPGGAAETELTISAGVVTPTGASHRIDTEADAGTDLLDHISITNHPEGRWVKLRGENAGRVVEVVHAAGGDGQILLSESVNTFLSPNDYLWLERVGTTWVQVRLQAKYINRAYAEYTTNANLTTQIPLDDTIPQNTEGVEILTASITPRKTTNRIRARFTGQFSHAEGSVQNVSAALFRDSIADALAATYRTIANSGHGVEMGIEFEHSPGTVSAVTYKIRVGPASAITTLRANGTGAARLFGGASRVTLVLEELEP